MPVLLVVPAYWLLAAVMAGVVALRWGARQRHRRIIGHLALAIRQNVPLAGAIRLAARGEAGGTRRRMIRISQCLEAGLSISESLRRGHPNCPGDVLSVVYVAESAGTLPAALRELQARMRRLREPEPQQVPMSLLYALIVGAVVVIFLNLVSVFVVPRFREIFRDFGAPLPAITQDIFNDGLWSGRMPESALGWSILALDIVLPWLVVALLIGFVLSLSPRRADHPSWAMRIADAFRWHLPLLRRAEQSRGLAVQIAAMELSLAAGWTLPDAIDHAAGLDANLCLRSRLREWSTRIRRGEDAVVAARAVAMPELLIQAIQSGMREGDLRPGLRYCQEYYESMIRHRGLLLRSMAWPLMTLLLGFVVGGFALGLIEPLATLIQTVCKDVG